ncbi:MAG: extracellular solute-binding protein, partial [Phycisphaerae bacterium]|nr:extracellular solute-binding protein [Phycisphaerae bacterium]
MMMLRCGLVAALVGLLLPWVSRASGHDLIIWTEWNDPSRNAEFHEFEREHPGWHIISSNSGDMLTQQQRLLCAVAGGSPPDVVLISRHTISDWASRQAFIPLDQMIADSQGPEKLAVAARDALRRGDTAAEQVALVKLRAALKPLGDTRQSNIANSLNTTNVDDLVALCQGVDPAAFYPAVWGDVLYSERAYGIPTDYDCRALYYNEDLLERAGIVDANGKAKPPTTWEELREDAIKLTLRDDKGRITQLGFSPNYGNSWLYLYGWQNGG